MATRERVLYWSRNGEYVNYPALPEWTKDFPIVTIVDPNLGDTTIRAAKSYVIKEFSNITYGKFQTTYCVDGVTSKLTANGWTEPVADNALAPSFLWSNSPYLNDRTTYPLWSNVDLVCQNGDGSTYIGLAGSEPVSLVIEYGWTDYGEDGEIDNIENNRMELYHGWSVAGAIRCRVNESSGKKFEFAWYVNGEMVRAQKDNRTYSDYKPSAGELGTHSCYCVVTPLDSDGNPLEADVSLRTDTIVWEVVAYNPGGDSGGGGGTAEESYVTDIAMVVSPDTVAPGGHALFAVMVNGAGNYNRSFTAQIEGHTSADTKLTAAAKGGNVWIGKDETADFVMVTVTSVQDPIITATELVYIDQNAAEEDGTFSENLQLAFWKGYAAARAMFGGAIDD